MANTRQKPSKTTKTWEVYHLGRTGRRLGSVKAVDAEQAVRKAVEEFDIKPHDLPRTLVRETG